MCSSVERFARALGARPHLYRQQLRGKHDPPGQARHENWLFIGHPLAGQRFAILDSLVISCKRHGKDPLANLRDVLTRLPKMTNQDDLAPLLPNWTPPTPA